MTNERREILLDMVEFQGMELLSARSWLCHHCPLNHSSTPCDCNGSGTNVLAGALEALGDNTITETDEDEEEDDEDEDQDTADLTADNFPF